MAIISCKEKNFSIKIEPENAKKLGLDAYGYYELVKLSEGVFAIVSKRKESQKKRIDKRIFSLLKEKSLADRVEGKFESFLNKVELQRFKELLKEGKIIPFKLSEKYRKAVYKLPEELHSEKERANIEESQQEQKPAIEAVIMPRINYSEIFERDGFIIIRDEHIAKELSDAYAHQLKAGAIIGIKSFDNEYYLIKKDIYAKYSKMIADMLADKKQASLEEISYSLKIPKELAKIVCEIMREEGLLAERKKGIYEYIA